MRRRSQQAGSRCLGLLLLLTLPSDLPCLLSWFPSSHNPQIPRDAFSLEAFLCPTSQVPNAWKLVQWCSQGHKPSKILPTALLVAVLRFLLTA